MNSSSSSCTHGKARISSGATRSDAGWRAGRSFLVLAAQSNGLRTPIPGRLLRYTIGASCWILLCIQDGYSQVPGSELARMHISSTVEYPFDMSVTVPKAVSLVVLASGSLLSLGGIALKNKRGITPNLMKRFNQSMKPTAPYRSAFSVFATGTLDFASVPRLPECDSCLRTQALPPYCCSTLAVAYDVFLPRKHPSGFPSMSHRFPRAPFSVSLDRLSVGL